MKFHDSPHHTSERLVPESRRKAEAVGESLPATETLDHLEPEDLTQTSTDQDERRLRPEDFVFLSGRGKCWLVRTADIWLLEACGGRTRIHMPEGTVLVRRTLDECERRLDGTTFFRATRDCIINLTHVKQTRLLDSSRVAFVLPNNKQVIVSGQQNAVFRKTRAL